MGSNQGKTNPAAEESINKSQANENLKKAALTEPKENLNPQTAISLPPEEYIQNQPISSLPPPAESVQNQPTSSSPPPAESVQNQPTSSSPPLEETNQNQPTSPEQQLKSSEKQQTPSSPDQTNMHYPQIPFPPPPPEQQYDLRQQGAKQPLSTDQPSFPSAVQANPYAYPYQQHVVYVQSDPQQMYRPGQTFRPDLIEGNNQNFDSSTFSDPIIRRTFIRKVYLILTFQLIFTLGIICLFVFEPNVRNFVITHPIMYWISFGIFFAVLLGLACSPNLRRQYPTNLIMLGIFTLAMSYMMGTISAMHETRIVLLAIAMCAVVCFVVTVFSFFTQFDFTTCGGILCILLIVLVIFGLVAIFVQSHIVNMVYAGLGAVLFMMYLAYDTQMIIGGKKYEMSPEEYVFAALTLYIDMIYIYMFILTLFGQSNI